MTEVTIPVTTLPRPGRRPAVPGLAVGQVVTGRRGRLMRVVATDVWLIAQSVDDADQDDATGPYAQLQALDDKHCTPIWPRAWYVAPGQQEDLFAQVEAV